MKTQLSVIFLSALISISAKAQCPYQGALDFEGYPVGYPCNLYISQKTLPTHQIGLERLLPAEKTVEMFSGEIIESGIFINQSNGTINFWPVKVACENEDPTQFGSIKLKDGETLILNRGSVRLNCHQQKQIQ